MIIELFTEIGLNYHRIPFELQKLFFKSENSFIGTLNSGLDSRELGNENFLQYIEEREREKLSWLTGKVCEHGNESDGEENQGNGEAFPRASVLTSLINMKS